MINKKKSTFIELPLRDIWIFAYIAIFYQLGFWKGLLIIIFIGIINGILKEV